MKTTEDRFALALTTLMNQLGAEGWDYVRADSLPCEERAGFTSTKTTFQNVLVFRRVIESLAVELPSQRLLLQEPMRPRRVWGLPTPPIPGNAPAVGPAKSSLAAE